MKTISKILFAAIFIGAALLTSCGKYEEGPKISLASKKARLVNNWKVEKIIVNGAEQNIAGYTITTEIKKDDTYSTTISMLGMSFSDKGKWAFSSDKESITMTPDSGKAETSTILRLKSKELWLKDVDGSTTTETHFIPN